MRGVAPNANNRFVLRGVVDELIILALQGRASPGQLEELDRWRRAEPQHQARHDELTALLGFAGQYPEIDSGRPVPTAHDVLRASELFERARWRRRSWLTRGAALTAALVAGMIIGRALTLRQPSPAGGTAFHTGESELASATLDDGTVVRMAPNTRLRVTPGAAREVFLEGRAFFAVARDAARPFRVRTAEGEATVLGTRFEVDTREQALRLLVVDGRVNVTSGMQDVELGAGELGIAERGAPAAVSQVPDPETMLGWMGAFVAFESTPLHRVARELQLRFDIQIEIVDPAIRDRTVTAWFGEDDQDEVVRVICITANVHCERTGDVVRMSS